MKRPDGKYEDNQRACIAFRLDDVQDLYLNDIQVAIINLFREENARLTLGIIGNAFGKDEMLLNHIRNSVREKDDSIIRVANHGWNHEDMTKFRKEDQSLLIKQSNQKIRGTLGINPSVFIPPFNLLNSDTIAALQENNMRYVSSSIKYDPPPYRGQDSIPYHFPMTVPTSYLLFNKFWFRIANTKIINRTLESIGKYGYAIILIHPQQYGPYNLSIYERELVKQKGLKNLHELIRSIRGNDMDITFIEEMNHHI